MLRPRVLAILLFLSLPALAAPAPPPATLRALLVICDDYVDPEANAIARSVKVDLATVSNFLGVLERRNIVRVEKTVVQGRKATSANVLAALKAMKSGPDDVLLVYFSGHGGMDNGRPFLAMAPSDDLLDRAQLLSTLDAKPARLRISLLDACTNESESSLRTRSFKRSSSSTEGRFDEIYRQLLYGFRGNLYAAASTEGEYAWSDDDAGAVFTSSFVKDGLLKNPQPSWTAVFQAARTKTMQAFNRMSSREIAEAAAEGIKSQTPRLLSAPVALAAAPVVVEPPVVVPPVVPPRPQPPATEEAEAEAGGVTLVNRSGAPVRIQLDRNDPDSDWDPRRVTATSIAAGAALSLRAPAVIGFVEGTAEAWYELEDGEYAFVGEQGAVELAQLVDGEAVDADEAFDLAALVTGSFDRVDGEEEGELEFRKDGRFASRTAKGRTLLAGTWEVDETEVDDEALFVLTLKAKERGRPVTYTYAFEAPDEDTLVLVLAERTVAGRVADASKGALDEVLVLFRR